jgi:PAS domain S-box-containing protein
MDQTAKEIVRTGLFDAQSQQHETAMFLVMVGRLAELLSSELGVDEICRELTRIIIEETGFENCSILLWDPPNDCLSLAAADGLENLLGGDAIREYNPDLKFATAEGLAGQAFVNRFPIFVEDSALEAIPLKTGAVVWPISLACLPLVDVGVLNISSFHPQRFTTQIRRYWELIGKIIGYFLIGVSLQGDKRNGRRDGLGRAHRSKGENGDEDDSVAESLRLTEDALQYIPQGICLLDADGNVAKVNGSIERCYGGSASELIGRSPSVIFHDPRMFEALFEKVASSPMEEMTDVPLVNAEGTVYSADLNLVKMSKNRTVRGYLLVINDVTKKKAFSEKMLQAEKLAALGTMAGGVAHDFNNLLMAILGNIQLILPQVQEEEILRRLKNIEKAVHDGANTVRRLQKFTESDRHHQLIPIAADVNEAIKDVVEMTRPRWKNAMEKHGHTIQFKMNFGPNCYTRIHVSDFREVLTNLVFNAIEAMPEGGTITISTKPLKDMVVMEVADTGIGMSQDLAAKIFDPFYTTKGIGNSGLGLSVSWSLIARAGGEIQVTSKSGKGSLFTIKLPKTDPPRKVSSPLDQRKLPTAQRLLLVDDDIEVLGILQDMLRFKGYRVVTATDGEKAVEIIEKEEFDLVVTDLGMPGISGWEVARTAKSKNPKIPVVLLTGWGAQYEEEDLGNKGVDIVLSKPLSWEKLTESIDKLL